MHYQVQSERPGRGVKLGYTWAFAAVWEGEGGASNTNHCHMIPPKLLHCLLFQQLNCVFNLSLMLWWLMAVAAGEREEGLTFPSTRQGLC